MLSISDIKVGMILDCFSLEKDSKRHISSCNQSLLASEVANSIISLAWLFGESFFESSDRWRMWIISAFIDLLDDLDCICKDSAKFSGSLIVNWYSYFILENKYLIFCKNIYKKHLKR